jgi:hypothetical protein
VRPTILNGSSLCDHWETFMSSGAYLNSSFSISEIGGFEGVVTSSTMARFSHALTKNQEGSRNNVVLAFRRGRGFFIITN